MSAEAQAQHPTNEPPPPPVDTLTDHPQDDLNEKKTPSASAPSDGNAVEPEADPHADAPTDTDPNATVLPLPAADHQESPQEPSLNESGSPPNEQLPGRVSAGSPSSDSDSAPDNKTIVIDDYGFIHEFDDPDDEEALR